MGKYITLPQDKYPKLTQEEILKSVAEMSYQSPVDIVSKGMQTKFEDDVMTAIHSYGVCVDKEELTKALQYDRNQYKQGFADGCRVGMGKIIAEVAREIFEKIETLLALNICAGDVFAGKYFDAELGDDIAELKKKYTEVEDLEQHK